MTSNRYDLIFYGLHVCYKKKYKKVQKLNLELNF